MNRLLTVLALILPLAYAAKAPPAEPAPAPAPVARGLVFATTTGLEDVMVAQNAFRHARLVKESGQLPEMTVVVYGRAIQIFDTSIQPLDPVRQELDAARAAGVRVVACEHAMSRFALDKAMVEQRAEVVPQGVVEVARLVAQGHEVLGY